ncbi:MAG TPA: hypothetical protein VFT65_11615 [Candidatus Angelobacter sp.]|nr:hypothetical protein [Candidatus Angelobacter sp.]
MIAALRQAVRMRRDWLLRRPFWRLVAHFGFRLFSSVGDSGEDGLGLSIGAILALLAAPGGFVAILILDKYSSLLNFFRGTRSFDPYTSSLPDQYFFLAFSMAVTGIVTVLKWDNIFPDRRDYMNLAPLPIATRQIFLANIIAITLVALIFAVDVNAASSLVFPMDVTMEQPRFIFFLQFAGAHFVGVVLSSLFAFFALFAVIGTLMAVLPDAVFRRISLPVRVLIVILLLSLLGTIVAVPDYLRSIASHPHSLMRWLPPLWFLGVVRVILGKAGPELVHLGSIGLRAMAGVLLLAPLAYAVSYYRYFIRIPETLDTTLRTRAPRKVLPIGSIDRMVLRSSFERATYRFTLKTLLRNQRHSLLLGAFAGLGLVIAMQTVASADGVTVGGPPATEILSAPFILAYFLLSGLRFVFDLPAELRANWVCQVILDHDKRESIALARKVMFTFVLPWLLLAGFPLSVFFWGWALGGGHIAVVTGSCYFLTEVLLRRFRKIPFTCSYLAWKQNATVMILLYIFGFWGFCVLLPQMENALARRSPLYLWIVAALALPATLVLRKLRNDEDEEQFLVFEEVTAPPFEVLNISGR